MLLPLLFECWWERRPDGRPIVIQERIVLLPSSPSIAWPTLAAAISPVNYDNLKKSPHEFRSLQNDPALFFYWERPATTWLISRHGNLLIFGRGPGMAISIWASIILRRAANPPKVLYLRISMHPPTHLVCNEHLIANFLSFHMSLVVVMNCGARNALRGFEISMFYFFLKLNFIHIFKDILPLRAQHVISNVNNIFPQSYNVKDYENIKSVNCHYAKPHSCPLYYAWFLKIAILGRGKCKVFFTEANFILMITKFVNLNQNITL